MSSDESNEGLRAKLPYERERTQPAAPEAGVLALDPTQWRYVRNGLTLVFWGWATVLAILSLFAIFWMGTLLFTMIDAAVVRTVEIASGCTAVVGILVAFAGQVLCTGVPKAFRARGFVIGSVAGMLVTALSIASLTPLVLAQPVQADPVQSVPPVAKEATPIAEPPTPENEVPKVEAPPGEEPKPGTPAGEPKIEAPAEAAPTPKVEAQPSGITLLRAARIWIVAAYVVSQILFILFLKRVMLAFHNAFLAESTGSFCTLLIFHAALVALLPWAAMVACFFWVMLVGLEFVLLVWYLNLLAGTRRAVG